MDMAPRKLPVFGKVAVPLSYPEAQPATILYDADTWQLVRLGEERAFVFEASEDSVCFDIRLLPTHPVSGERLAFSVSVDGSPQQQFDYQTYDRSEEWKQNVLRNYAQRYARFALGTGIQHTLTFKALTEGVYLRSIRRAQ